MTTNENDLADTGAHEGLEDAEVGEEGGDRDDEEPPGLGPDIAALGAGAAAGVGV